MKLLIIGLVSLMTCKTQKIENTENMNKSMQIEDSTYKLHDIWALESINDSTANLDSLTKGVPVLEMRVADKQFGGNSSCNNYGGTIDTLTNTEIQFGPIMATKMFCFNSIEKQYFKALEKTASYKIEKLHLFLYDKEGNELIVFKKVD